jgi:hypothetical protein
MSAEIFLTHALKEIPKLLMLQDRNPHSPVYGCFDRNYWQYRIIDFPSGMAQEFTYPLALAYSLDVPGNKYAGDEALGEWIRAGIFFAAKSAHKDGSCDDFFPYERAAGAAAFSLFACMESYSLLGMDDPELVAFFESRGRWLALHKESGRLSNHEALIVYCLFILIQRFGVEDLRPVYQQRLARLLSWQHEEGWFQEYEGCDLGYQTLTIALLAQLYEEAGDETLKEPLTRAIAMTAEFIHPDGSFGGEYSSRNTYNFFPHGFELAGKWLPEALNINDRFIAGMQAGRAPCYSDDHMVAHHMWSYLLSARYFVTKRAGTASFRSRRAYFPGAGLLVDRRDGTELYAGLNKGGVFKLFRGDEQVISDTQLSFKMLDGATAVCHLIDDYTIEVEGDRISVSGEAGWAKQKLMTLRDNLILRSFMFLLGRFFPNFVRRFLQAMLITHKRKAPFRFSRNFHWREGAWQVVDEVYSDRWADVASAGISGYQTSIFVIQSRPYQHGQHQMWNDLSDNVREINAGEALKIERIL